MSATNTHPARGMRDFLPEEVRRRQYVIGVIADVFQRYGFEPLETPAVENIETLMGKYGEEGDRLIFRILRRGSLGDLMQPLGGQALIGEQTPLGESSRLADLALRYDLTVPLARVVAEYRATLPKFFKRYQVQPVWRADRPQKGRFREFYQCDVDAIGSRSMVVETEMLGAAAEVFLRLGFDDFAIRINHRRLLEALLTGSAVSRSGWSDYLSAADELDKLDEKAAIESIVQKGHEVDDASRWINWLREYRWRRGKGEPIAHVNEGLEHLAQILGSMPGQLAQNPVAESATNAIGDLERILQLSESTPAKGRIVFDFSLVRGLSYYTGPIFEIVTPDLAGSLGGGGRYDGLIGMFLGEQVPACGISLGLERILVVMGERKMFPESLVGTSADVMVTIWNANSAADAVRLAGELRAAGLRTDVYPDPDKIGKQFKYASSRGIKFVTVVGDDEAASGQVAVKNLATGDQKVLPRADVAAFIKNG